MKRDTQVSSLQVVRMFHASTRYTHSFIPGGNSELADTTTVLVCIVLGDGSRPGNLEETKMVTGRKSKTPHRQLT